MQIHNDVTKPLNEEAPANHSRPLLPDSIKGHVATRTLTQGQMNASLQTLLAISPDGILITDLNHVALACNSFFAKIFLVNVEDVPQMNVEELRSKVIPRLKDPQAWLDQLDEIYAVPDKVHEDELELTRPQRRIIKRKSIPLADQSGAITGRLWSFADTTDEKMRDLRRDILQRVSMFHHPDPSKVCQLICDEVAALYSSTSILSILDDRTMRFINVANPPSGMETVRSNTLDNSFCQLPMRQEAPVLVQDASEWEELSRIEPVCLGLSRYLGVPIKNTEGVTIGTLCFLDNRSEDVLGEEDVEFMVVLSNRISAEIERERLVAKRLEDQLLALEDKELALRQTEKVLTSINQMFALVGSERNNEELLESMADCISGVLKFESVAIFDVDGNRYRGFGHGYKGSKSAVKRKLNPLIERIIQTPTPQVLRMDRVPELAWTDLGWVTVVNIPIDERRIVLLLGSKEPPALNERFVQSHLHAIIDQTALIVSAHLLQSRLKEANETLRRAREQMIEQEKLSVVGTLAASVAHDIRNILSAIAIEVATGEDQPAQTLASVRSQCERFSVLSHRLLAYVRPRSLSSEQIDLKLVIERCERMLAAQARISGIQVSLDFPAHVPNVTGDPHRVEHLFVNLLLNAFQSIQRSSGKVRVAAKVDSRRVIVKVTDDGKGIAPERLANLFEPFSSSRPDGFGLGLYSCKQIAQEHGWVLTVETEVGIGTTFKIEIPLRSRP